MAELRAEGVQRMRAAILQRQSGSSGPETLSDVS